MDPADVHSSYLRNIRTRERNKVQEIVNHLPESVLVQVIYANIPHTNSNL